MVQPSTPLRGRLRYLQLGSEAPETLASFYAGMLDMRLERTENDWICRGPGRHLLISKGPANKLLTAGFEAADADVLAGLADRLQDAGISHDRSATAIFSQAVSFSDPDGNRMSFGISRPDAKEFQGLPARLQHVVVASKNARRLVQFYTEIVGMRVSDLVLTDSSDLSTCFLRTDNEHHSFAIFQTSENRLDHHSYESPDWNAIRDWADRFSERQILVKWGPGRHGPGNNLFIFIHDPDGNWIEISADLERVEEMQEPGVWPHEERTLNRWGPGLLRT